MREEKRKSHPKMTPSKNYINCTKALKTMQEDTQNYLVLKHILEHGTVSALEMVQEYGILATHSRISNLRNDYGLPIRTEMFWRNGKHWGVYSIEGIGECQHCNKYDCPFGDSDYCGYEHEDDNCPRWEEHLFELEEERIRESNAREELLWGI